MTLVPPVFGINWGLLEYFTSRKLGCVVGWATLKEVDFSRRPEAMKKAQYFTRKELYDL
jgi:hypothetical protein